MVSDAGAMVKGARSVGPPMVDVVVVADEG